MNIFWNEGPAEWKGNSPKKGAAGSCGWFALALCLILVVVASSTARAEQVPAGGSSLNLVAQDLVSQNPVSQNPVRQKAPASEASEVDPFLAAALGIIPLASGYYVTESPASGAVFTLVDVLLVLGIYTSRYTERGDPGDVKYYYALMGVNNVLDAVMSARHVAKKRPLQSRVSLLPEGGIQYALHWKF